MPGTITVDFRVSFEEGRGVSLALLFTRQFVLLLVASGLATQAFEPCVGWSFLLGGLLHITPSMYFARQVFKHSGAESAQLIAQAVYRGEAGKFLLTATGFALVFRFVEPLFVPALFAGFVFVLISHTLGVARFSR